MNVNVSSMVDGLAGLIVAIENDGQLRAWFSALAKKSPVERRNLIYARSRQMDDEPGMAKLLGALKLLAIPEIFDAAWAAIQAKGAPV